MYVYLELEPGVYTVGFYSPNGAWNPESDCDSENEAAERVNYLNGGSNSRKMKKRIDLLESAIAYCYGIAQGYYVFDEIIGNTKKMAEITINSIIEAIEQVDGWKSID